nr:hypothetical protein [Tanacetum cinerariifolium]
MPPMSKPMTQDYIRRMIKDSVDAAIAAERARQVNVKNDAKGKKVKFATATLEGPALTWWKTKVANIGLETVNQMPWTEMKQLMTANKVTSSKPADLNEAVRMAHKLMEQKLHARDARILEGKKRKWDSLQGGNSSGKLNQKDNSSHTLQNSQNQGNVQAMVTAPTDGKLPLCEQCFIRHVSQCTIKCHKCGKVGHKATYCKEKSVATGANAQPIWTCYDYGEQGHTRNRCPKKVKQEEVGEANDRAYAIKDAETQGPNVVTGTFLLSNRYAFVLFDSGFNKSFMDTRFSAMLDIDPIKIGASYEVELADGRVAMESVVCIPYGNETLIVKSDKGMPRLKVISCIKARKYIERGCHLFLTHVTKSKSKEKRMENVPVIRNFPEVFLEEFPGLPPSRQDVEEHEKHLKIILELLKKERLYAKFSKCDFWLDSVQFLSHVIDHNGVHVDPAKIEAIKNWAAPTMPTEVMETLFVWDEVCGFH